MMVVVFVVASLSRLPVLQTWWCLDDWGQLLRAAGESSLEGGLPARWFSQHFYWEITWPVFGMSAVAHAVLRICLHAVGATVLVRMAKRIGMAPEQGFVAGLLLAATPIAFTPLFWASGVQELLAGVLAILAVDRWLANGRATVWTAGLLMLGSLMAKETGLGLPVLFLILLALQRGTTSNLQSRWAVVLLGLVVASTEALLVTRHFATGSEDPYRLDGLKTLAGNLGMFGHWLATPGPTFTGHPTWGAAGTGLAFFAAWWLAGVYAWRRGKHAILGTVVAATLSLGPALPLYQQAKPYMAYGAAAAAALAIGSIVPARWIRYRGVAVVLTVASLLWGASMTAARINKVDGEGRPLDPVVRAARIARETVDAIRPVQSSGSVVVFQQPLRSRDVEQAEQFGPQHLADTERVAAAGGEDGLALALARSDVFWRSSLLEIAPDATVFTETAAALEPWGTPREALLRAAVIDIYVGSGARARAELARAVELGIDPGQPGLDPVEERMDRRFLLEVRIPRYADWLMDATTSGLLPMEQYLEARRQLDRLAEGLAEAPDQ